ncbi:MAG: hypothetical protein DYG89_07725 [Caldilinea sp. CFX5]|nr:hypothetical protein [Caldilinea sp. CFX5]
MSVKTERIAPMRGMPNRATKWQQIRYIMLPMLLPLIIILVLLSIRRIFNADFGLFFFVPRDTPMLYSTFVLCLLYAAFQWRHNICSMC